MVGGTDLDTNLHTPQRARHGRPFSRFTFNSLLQFSFMHQLFVAAMQRCPFSLLLLLCFSSASALDPWRNTSIPIPERVADLIARLSLSEKGSLLSSATPAIDRLGIPAFNWGTECLHGVADSVLPATVFPQPIALGASFNTTLARLIGTAISDEARALYNDGNPKFLQFFAPNMNLFRDPR